MFNNIKPIFFLICFLFMLLSCQKTEFLDDVVFDNSQLKKISINAEIKEINISYQATFDEPHIDHVMSTSPTNRAVSWIDNNIINFGNENKIIIDIKKASLVKKEIDKEVIVAGVVTKKKEYLYELNFEVFFILYNDSNQVLATAKAETYRSTTSSKFISLKERDQILDNLTLVSLRDLSNKSVELIKLYMHEYML